MAGVFALLLPPTVWCSEPGLGRQTGVDCVEAHVEKEVAMDIWLPLLIFAILVGGCVFLFRRTFSSGGC